MSERIYKFNWDIIGDLQEGRPNLGDEVNLVLYRLMQYTFLDVAVKKFGNEETGRLFRDAGNIAGKAFFENFLGNDKDLPLDSFLEKLRTAFGQQGVRFCRVDAVDVDHEEFTLSIATGIEGAGPQLAQLNDHHYAVGFVEGLLFQYSGKNFKPGTINIDTNPDIIPKMGDPISLVAYRLLQYTFRDVAEQKVGAEACDQLFYKAGEVAGYFFFDNFLTEFKDMPLNGFFGELQRLLKDLGVGVLRVEKADAENGNFTLTVSEDLDCSGLPDLDIEVCNYDEGFIAGIFHKFTGITFNVKEVDCWCSGDRTCRFVVNRA